MKTPVAGAFSVFLLLVAVWFVWSGTQRAFTAYASNGWTPAPGVITYSAYEYSGTGSNSVRRPVVRYRYTVAGADHRSDRISFGYVPGDRGAGALLTTRRTARIKAIVNQDAGPDITVYYNPDDPAQAVLLRGGSMIVLIYYFGAAMAGAMAVLCFMLASGRIEAKFSR